MSLIEFAQADIRHVTQTRARYEHSVRVFASGAAEPQVEESLNTHAGDVVVVADALGQQPVADLPGEDRRTLALELGDLVHHGLGRHPGLGAADGARLDRPRLVVPGDNASESSFLLKTDFWYKEFFMQREQDFLQFGQRAVVVVFRVEGDGNFLLRMFQECFSMQNRKIRKYQTTRGF